MTNSKMAATGYGLPITPTGYLVTTADPGTPLWFEARRAGITGTDLPKIVGLSKYGTSLGVWLDKRGELEDDGGKEAAKWGHLLEDVVAQEWARGESTRVREIGVVANIGAPWMRASLDRIVEVCPDGDGPCGLEIKTRSAYKAGLFRDDVPDDVLAQVQWGLMVTGFAHMHVAVLIGGQSMKSFRVDRDAAVEDYLMEAARPVWDAVERGVPPHPDADAEGVLLQELINMFRDREGDREVSEKAAKHIDLYRTGHLVEKDGARSKTLAKTELVRLLDDGDTGLVDGVPVYTFKQPDPADSIPAEQVRRLKAERPALYAELRADGYIVTTQGNPKFLMKRSTTDGE